MKKKGLRYKRRGKCNRCGWCCEYKVCPEHLYYDKRGRAVCRIYGRHPLECRLFPQAPPILNKHCGYYFIDTWEGNRIVKFGKDLEPERPPKKEDKPDAANRIM